MSFEENNIWTASQIDSWQFSPSLFWIAHNFSYFLQIGSRRSSIQKRRNPNHHIERRRTMVDSEKFSWSDRFRSRPVHHRGKKNLKLQFVRIRRLSVLTCQNISCYFTDLTFKTNKEGGTVSALDHSETLWRSLFPITSTQTCLFVSLASWTRKKLHK